MSDAASPRESVVYFIQSGKTGPIKIGIAFDVSKRLSGLQCGCPDVLRLVGTVPGGRALEAKLHTRFWKLLYRGEWFEAGWPLVKYIRSNTTVQTHALADLVYSFEKAEADERKRKGKRLIGDWVYEVDRSWRE